MGDNAVLHFRKLDFSSEQMIENQYRLIRNVASPEDTISETYSGISGTVEATGGDEMPLMMTVPSALADANSVPSGLNVTPLM